MKKQYAVGVDIGGTKVAVGLVDSNGTVDMSLRVPSQVDSAESLFRCVCSAIDDLLSSQGLTIQKIKGIGIGLPGKVDVENGVAVFQNNIPWKNFPVVARFKEVYGDLPIKIDNDVKVAAYAEYRLLDLDSSDMFGYITISTGIAATNIINNSILRGSGFAGEIGFMPVQSFGRTSGLELACSGPAIELQGKQMYGVETISTKDVFENWRAGDRTAKAIIENACTGIAQAIQNMVCFLDPKVIVLGGSVALHNLDFVEEFKEELKLHLHKEHEHILNNILVSKIEGNNGIIGSAFLVQ
ncbi:ROK family protein [Streptococcus sp. ZY1909104]|uniref:ROK family protein n=1 Tax=Streptococcus sp. ZY1909104 TaxID=3233335 RepID=UPI00349F6AE5